jgi:hypothetical protein
MKRMIILLLAIPLLVGCTHLRESDTVDPVIHGKWAGQAKFYDRELNEEYGEYSMTIEIHPDNSVSGTVGSAGLEDGVIKSRPNDFLIEANLIGDVMDSGSIPGESKDSLVLIINAPDNGSAAGDFHLKTNLFLDFSMRAGELNLSRTY